MVEEKVLKEEVYHLLFSMKRHLVENMSFSDSGR